MNDDQGIRMTLRLEHGGEQEAIEGWLQPDGREPQRFEGWLQLLTLLQSLDRPEHDRR